MSNVMSRVGVKRRLAAARTRARAGRPARRSRLRERSEWRRPELGARADDKPLHLHAAVMEAPASLFATLQLLVQVRPSLLDLAQDQLVDDLRGDSVRRNQLPGRVEVLEHRHAGEHFA